MKPATAHKILTRWMHWTPLESQLPPEPKLILLGVPHSSIWDFGERSSIFSHISMMIGQNPLGGQ